MNKIVDEAYADLIIESGSEYAAANPENITPFIANYSILHIPIEEVDKCSIGRDFAYYNFPTLYTLQSLTSLESSGITTIQNNPNLALRGQGVLIGIIDTGIDYMHEAFIRPDGSTKIASIWDQTLNDEEPASGDIPFGREFDKEAIDIALRSENPLELVPTTDENGHGTMIAGIAAGNESLNNDFRGVVPDSELVVVKLKQAKYILREVFSVSRNAICYQETDILFATNYILSVAGLLNRPVVICIALGSNQGGHDGRGILSTYLSQIMDIPGSAVVIAAGNEGNSRRHYFGTIGRDSNYNEIELRVGEDEPGFSMEIWQSPPHRLSVDILSPAGEYISPIFPQINECRRYSFIFETTNVYINNMISEAETGDQLILIRFEYPTEGIWRFRLYNLDDLASNFNIWLPTGALISEDTYFLNSDPNITLTSPGTSLYPITITAYNHVNNSIWIDSSRGYTRIGTIKPDLAAPGVDLACPLLNNSYGRVSGTGAAAAHAAGIVAMLYEWGIVNGNYPNIYGTEIRMILIRGAVRDRQLVYPNNIWGYGIIDAYGAFMSLSSL